jgi:hypothetical protein
MLSGADKARLATAITTGARQPEVTKSISCINAKPAEALAVKVLAPVAEAARQAVMALCSDSNYDCLRCNWVSSNYVNIALFNGEGNCFISV